MFTFDDVRGHSHSQFHLCRQYDDPPLRHSEELRRLRTAALHPGKQSPPQPLIATARPWHDQVPAEEERAILREQLQTAVTTLLERLPLTSGVSMKPKRAVTE